MLEEELEPKSDDGSSSLLIPRSLQDIDIGENTMAEVDTVMLAGQHSDIRREAAEHTNEIVREGLKNAFGTERVVENAADRVVDRIVEGRDVMNSRFFDVGRDTSDLRAQIVAQQQQIVAGFGAVAKDAEISVLKNTIEGEKNTRYLSDKIESDGERTRALINELKYGDLNRELIERNSLLVEERFGRRWYRDQGQFQSQFAALQQQVQAFNSQLQETRQGMVNFGTMAGVGQTSTSNNVR
jgi:hypothetical protein